MPVSPDLLRICLMLGDKRGVGLAYEWAEARLYTRSSDLSPRDGSAVLYLTSSEHLIQ